MQLEPLVRARVVAGVRSLEHEIKSVSVIEVPDVWRWLRGGEMLLTTGYPVRSDPEAQVSLVRQLARKDVAALVVKPKRFLDVMPEGMVQTAEELGLPLIELPVDISFVDVINVVFGHLLGDEADALRESEKATRQLLDMVVEGRGLQPMVSFMARIITNPVTFHSADGKVLAVAADQNADLVLDSVARLDTVALKSLVKKNGRSRRIQAAPQPGLVVPAEANGQVYGYLCLWQINPFPPAVSKLADSMALAAALEVGRQQSAEKVERRYASQFVQQLVGGRLRYDVAAQQASSLGLKLLPKSYPLAVSAAAPLERTEAVTRDVTARFNPAAIVAAVGEAVTVIWQEAAPAENRTPVAPAEDRTRAAPATPGPAAVASRSEWTATCGNARSSVDLRLGQWFNDLCGALGGPCTVVVGAQAGSLKELAEAYSGVEKALKTLKGIGARGSRMVFTRDLAVLRLIASCPQEELTAFRDTVLGPLLRHDAGREMALTETLRQFLACNGNIRAASARLFVHANTLKYRLKRIEELTGMKLEEGDVRTALAVAFLADDLLGRTG